MRKEHKKKALRDISRSRSKETKKTRNRRSLSRSSSVERSHYRQSKSRSEERLRWASSRNRSRSRERSQMKSHSTGKGRKKSRSRERERKRSYSRETDLVQSRSGGRQRQKSQSKTRERDSDFQRERQRSHSRERSRIRSASPRGKKSRHRSQSADRYEKRSKHKERLCSSSEESLHRVSSKSLSSYRKDKKDNGKHKKNDKKHKKKKSRSSSSSSESSDESAPEDEFTILHRLQKERERVKDENVKKKKYRKLLETPAEKRLRRLQKKEAKERKRKEKMGWDSEYLHFTNADNPYGDNNLLDTFVWKKKLEKDGQTELTREDIEKQNRAKMEDNRLELEKVKKRRQEREMERLEREKMMELEQRQREAAQFSQFSRQEDQFQLEQARLRSQIRIQDGRAKPIDLLAHYVSSEGDVSAVDVHEPYMHLTGLTLVDLEDLLEDIRVYMQLEKEDVNQWYWTDLTIIVQDELRRLRQRDAIQDATSHRQGIHAAVASDVSSIFHNKSLDELNKLQINIESKLAGPTTGLDIGYWESLLSQLKAHQARARLRERHRDNLRKKLEMLKAEQGVKVEDEEEAAEEELEDGNQPDVDPIVQMKEETSEDSRKTSRPKENNESSSEEESEEKKESKTEGKDEEWDSGCEGDSAISSAITAYNAGRYSPRLLAPNKMEPGTVVVDEDEDIQRLAWARRRVLGAGQPVETVLSAEEKVMQQEAQRAMTNDEAQFSVEAKLDPQHFLWSDKYRPRKPRYFNRVHTGFEWNKYNQTHYDMDNPPPKIVQGYKFNIFYPDLIDKSKTPQYELIPCTDNKDFAVLKFTAGPPYESIAFKIVNREWEYSYKRGFRCQFHNNIFQLWFHFKRYRYRR